MKRMPYDQVLGKVLRNELTPDYTWTEHSDYKGRPVKILKPDAVTRNLRFISGTTIASDVEITYTKDRSVVYMKLIKVVTLPSGKKVFGYEARNSHGQTWITWYLSDGKPLGGQVLRFTPRRKEAKPWSDTTIRTSSLRSLSMIWPTTASLSA